MSRELFTTAVQLAEEGQTDSALPLCESLLQQQPDHLEGWLLLCRLNQQQLKFEEWLSAAKKAVMLKPDHAACHAEAAAAHLALRNYYPAVQHYYRAHQLAPDVANHPFQMGRIMQILGKHDEAVQCYMKALSIDKTMTEGFDRMGTVLADAGKYEESILAFGRALKLEPDRVDTHANLAKAYIACGRIEEALASYQRAMALAPEIPEIHASYVFASNYLPDLSYDEKFALHRQWAEKFAPVSGMHKQHTNSISPPRRLKIGYVSRSLHRHPVSAYLPPLLRQHDRNQFELYAYAFNLRVDEVTNDIRSLVHHWRDVAKWEIDQVCQQIRDDGIDILIDLSGHEYSRQLLVFAQKPAPVQVSWLGYFNTTGLDLDYFVSDEVSSPEGYESQFSEKLVRLPRTRFCYQPERYAPATAKLPAKKNKFVTFGCFNNLAKINHRVIALWAKVLHAVPNSKLLLKARALNDEATIQDYTQRFAVHGIDAHRLIFRPYSNKHVEVYRAYSEVDIALDPFPFTGCVTTCEGLWMGVPLVTLAGSHLVARQGASFMHALDLPDWVAESEEDYIRIAVEKSNDLNALTNLRKTLRARMKASPLLDANAFTRHMETAYQAMWQRWLDQ